LAPKTGTDGILEGHALVDGEAASLHERRGLSSQPPLGSLEGMKETEGAWGVGISGVRQSTLNRLSEAGGVGVKDVQRGLNVAWSEDCPVIRLVRAESVVFEAGSDVAFLRDKSATVVRGLGRQSTVGVEEAANPQAAGGIIAGKLGQHKPATQSEIVDVIRHQILHDTPKGPSGQGDFESGGADDGVRRSPRVGACERPAVDAQ
jgi:hypothetical protein